MNRTLDLGKPDRYAVQDEIGAGGMGAVYRVTDKELGREVAAKTLLPELTEHPDCINRFLEEARATGRLEHPNIIPIHDLGTGADGVPYFTMQLVRGETLAAKIARLKADDLPTHEHYTWTRRITLMMQVCDAIAYAHSRGVLHRDLKPENIMVGPYGEVIVMDWGLAARQDDKASGDVISGTPAYSAPEQLMGKPPDKRSDVYGIAATLYEFLTLRPPHDGETLADQLQSALTNDVPPADSFSRPLQGRVPREVAAVLERALAREPEQRPPTAEALKQELGKYLDGQAPVLCVHTGAKRMANILARFIDNYGRLAIILLVFVLTFPWMLLGGLLLAGF